MDKDEDWKATDKQGTPLGTDEELESLDVAALLAILLPSGQAVSTHFPIVPHLSTLLQPQTEQQPVSRSRPSKSDDRADRQPHPVQLVLDFCIVSRCLPSRAAVHASANLHVASQQSKCELI